MKFHRAINFDDVILNFNSSHLNSGHLIFIIFHQREVKTATTEVALKIGLFIHLSASITFIAFLSLFTREEIFQFFIGNLTCTNMQLNNVMWTDIIATVTWKVSEGFNWRANDKFWIIHERFNVNISFTREWLFNYTNSKSATILDGKVTRLFDFSVFTHEIIKTSNCKNIQHVNQSNIDEESGIEIQGILNFHSGKILMKISSLLNEFWTTKITDEQVKLSEN